MLTRSHTFHGDSGCRRRFNVPQGNKEAETEGVRLPPIRPSQSEPQQSGLSNNELARRKAQQTVSGNPKLCFSQTSMFPSSRETKTAISVHPKFLEVAPSSRRYYAGYSPYLMDRDSQQRYFMSGYAGFVPRLRHLLGATYPVLSHDALNEFEAARRAHTAALAGAANAANTDGRGRRREGLIYRRDEGLPPCYQGHIPGHQRRFGQSFGSITMNALELP